MKPLFDTNILIDHLNGACQASELLKAHPDRAICSVTWIEVMAGGAPDVDVAMRAFLSDFRIVALDDAVAEEAARLRRTRRVKLADAVVWASARVTGRVLLTRDAKDFPANDPGGRVPYRLP